MELKFISNPDSCVYTNNDWKKNGDRKILISNDSHGIQNWKEFELLIVK
jgi:hypothetical protein